MIKLLYMAPISVEFGQFHSAGLRSATTGSRLTLTSAGTGSSSSYVGGATHLRCRSRIDHRHLPVEWIPRRLIGWRDEQTEVVARRHTRTGSRESK